MRGKILNYPYPFLKKVPNSLYENGKKGGYDTDFTIKGTVSRDFLYLVFFHLSSPPGPIRDVQGPF